MNSEWTWGWNAIAAIGQAVGALFTAAAVIIALWSTILSNRNKLKIRVWGGGPKMPITEIRITVVNVGSRTVTLQLVGLIINKFLVYKLKKAEEPKIHLHVGEKIEEVLTYDDELMKLAIGGQKKDYRISAFASDEEGHFYKKKTKLHSIRITEKGYFDKLMKEITRNNTENYEHESSGGN